MVACKLVTLSMLNFTEIDFNYYYSIILHFYWKDYKKFIINILANKLANVETVWIPGTYRRSGSHIQTIRSSTILLPDRRLV